MSKQKTQAVVLTQEQRELIEAYEALGVKGREAIQLCLKALPKPKAVR